MFILLLTGCLSNVVGDWRAAILWCPVKISYTLSFEKISLVFTTWRLKTVLRCDCTRERRWRRGFELDITTETLICEPIEKETSTRVIFLSQYQ